MLALTKIWSSILFIKLDPKCLNFQIIFQCTFPGCRDQRSTVNAIESHVRVQHLGRPETLTEEEEEEDDHDEEFYYTEIEVPTHTSPKTGMMVPPTKGIAALSLADHLDMARPAHEDPGRVGKNGQVRKVPIPARHSQQQSLLSSSLPNQTIYPSLVNGKPYNVLLSKV